MRRTIQLATIALLLIGRLSAQQEPEKFFREFAGLNDDQLRDIRAGKAVAKLVESPTPAQVFVFGAVYIHSTPERYLKLSEQPYAIVPGTMHAPVRC